MRNLISSLKNHNEQLKGEVTRYRRKLRETQMEVNKVCHQTLQSLVIDYDDLSSCEDGGDDIQLCTMSAFVTEQ